MWMRFSQLVLVFALNRAAPLAAQCLPSAPTDSTAAALSAVKAEIVQMVTGTDTGTVRVRTYLNLPSLSASQVKLVTDAATCGKAAAALAATTTNGDSAQGAWVFSLGSSRYIAFNGHQNAHGSGYAVVFDRKFIKLSSFPF